MMRDILETGAHTFGIALTEEKLSQFEQYYALLVEWNERMNLTAITDPAAVTVRHFLDSISCAQTGLFAPDETVIDVGSGAGFPGLPLAICFSDTSFVLLDSLQKRVQFLNTVISSLGLNNVTAVHARAEDAARGEWRERFGIALSRAVAPLNVLCELCLPFVKVGGHLIAMKGKQAAQEQEEAANAVCVLGGNTKNSMPVSIDDHTRRLILIEKTASTPLKYPRKAGKPSKNPI